MRELKIRYAKMIGNPKNPMIGDIVTLVDSNGTAREFTVFFVDDRIVNCQSFTRSAVFTHKEFEELFIGDDQR